MLEKLFERLTGELIMEEVRNEVRPYIKIRNEIDIFAAWLRNNGDDKTITKFNVWCISRFEHLIIDDNLKDVFETLTLYVEGLKNKHDLYDASLLVDKAKLVYEVTGGRSIRRKDNFEWALHLAFYGAISHYPYGTAMKSAYVIAISSSAIKGLADENDDLFVEIYTKELDAQLSMLKTICNNLK